MGRPLSYPPPIGSSYGRLSVSGDRYTVNENGKNISFIPVICVCGNKLNVRLTNLVNGKKISCGCLIKDVLRNKRTTMHNLSRTREYRAWRGMIIRCYNKNYKLFHRYGGRGITVCDRWKSSLLNFISDMGNCPSGKSSIDRIENDGNYDPDNCRWSDPIEQSNNRSSCRIYEMNGQSKNLKKWAQLYGISYKLLWDRINRGLSLLDALTTPIDQKQSKRSKKRI